MQGTPRQQIFKGRAVQLHRTAKPAQRLHLRRAKTVPHHALTVHRSPLLAEGRLVVRAAVLFIIQQRSIIGICGDGCQIGGSQRPRSALDGRFLGKLTVEIRLSAAHHDRRGTVNVVFIYERHAAPEGTAFSTQKLAG